jgi:hypothetical protein
MAEEPILPALILALDVFRVVGDRLRSSSSRIPSGAGPSRPLADAISAGMGSVLPFSAGLTLPSLPICLIGDHPEKEEPSAPGPS